MKKILFALLIVSPCAFSGIDFNTVKVNEQEFLITLSSDISIEIGPAQELIYPEAQKVCGDQSIGYGKYIFKNTEAIGEDAGRPAGSFKFKQNVICGADELGPDSKSKPTLPVDEKKVKADARRATNSYFNYLQTGDFDEAYSLLASSMKSYSNPKEWKEKQKAFTQLAGSPLKSDLWRISIYIDPPSAPQKGVYAAVDYERSYQEVPIHCGYLMWYLREKGDLEIIREETGYVDSTLMEKVEPSDVAQIKAQLRCKSQ